MERRGFSLKNYRTSYCSSVITVAANVRPRRVNPLPSPEFPGVFQRGQYRSCPVASPSPRRCFPTYAGQSPEFTATSRPRRPSSHRSFICDLPCHDTTSLLSEFILSPNSAEVVSARLIEVW